ncbi:MFS transporter [Spelaeicoccus albus]|uniref:Putative proline/betaine transporter n=1 Tax=Spelaeicoccus albus TaxID=1280376 RepID=A0A7Z0AC36_9MICO|nr:MFS transporter [Spelaeicoccus albus]NYI67145.1 MFS family permease [Spelaeicoccus albus]
MSEAINPEPHTIDTKQLRRVSAGSLIGTAIEWYDYFVYGLLAALVLGKLFFPSSDPAVSTIAAFLSFAIGFAARPVGSIIFGHLGDRIGRRNTLITTVLVMGISSGAIGLLPTYQTIGVWAPILLVTMRIVEGLSVGGEWGGAVLMAVEHAPAKKRAFYGAMPQYGSPVGNLGSSGIVALVTLLPRDQFEAWGWRIPFLISFVLMGIALYIRYRVDETPEFKKLLATGREVKVPLFDVIRTSWRRLLVGVCASLVGSAPFYLLTTFIVSYGTNSLHLAADIMLTGTMLGAVLEGIAIFIGGQLGDKFTPWAAVAFTGLLSVVLAFPLMLMVGTGSPVLVIIAVGVGIGLLGLPYGALGSMMAQMFSDRSRYTAVALSYNVSGAIGGFAPSVALAAVSAFGGTLWATATLLAFSMLVTAVGGFMAGRAAGNDSTRRA